MRGKAAHGWGAVAVGERADAALREGGTQTGIKTLLEGVSCVWELLCKGRQHLPIEAVTA